MDRSALTPIVRPLLDWYQQQRRRLPWREDPQPYAVWISEIMLQQTRVEAVLPYFSRFLAAFPDVKSLAAAPEEQLLKLWEGLGYYSRARNLQKAARILMERYDGQLPADAQALLRLPGIGEYTAGAIASIAFGLPVPAVDGNVLRVVARVCGDDGDITTAAMKRKVTKALEQVIPLDAPGDFNQAMMELGATVCLPNGAPLCGQCPAAHLCRAFREERTAELPVKAPKKARRVEQRTVYLLFYGDRVALRRRPEKGLLAGLWEYPNELSDGADWLKLWGLSTPELVRAGAGKHIFTHIEWHMTALAAQLEGDALPDGWVWADRAALRDTYALPNAFQFVTQAVNGRLGKF